MLSPRLSAVEVRPEERAARLEALAAELTSRGWIAHRTQPPTGAERLFVQNRSCAGQRGHVLAAPDDGTGLWCYWLAVTGECLGSADEPATAAAAVIQRLGRDRG